MANQIGGGGGLPLPPKYAASLPPTITPNSPGYPKGGGGSVPGAAAPSGNTGSTPASGFDWQQYLQNWGFPPDVIAQLTKIFSGSDVNQDTQAALAYIRGTPWYATTFPGIQAGINNGLVNDESGYRAYTNDLNQLYQRYYGRSATSQEVSNALTGGQTASQLGAHFQGQANIAATGNQIQYTLGAFDTQGRASDAELNSYGDQTAGLDNIVGTQLQQRLSLAQQKMQRIFSGTLATPALSMLKGSALQGTSLNPAANAPDLTA